METSVSIVAQLGRILIVGEDAAIVISLGELLAAANYDAKCFTSTEKALESLRGQVFDVLLADLTMPGTDGIAMLRAARDIDPDLIGIVMEERSEMGAAIEAMKMGAYDYILKPCLPDELPLMLARCMETRRLRRENLQLRTVAAPSSRTALNPAQEAVQPQSTDVAQDIAELTRMEEELRRSHDEMEIRVEQRTTELAAMNHTLQNEVAERQMAMGALRDTVEQLEHARKEAEHAQNEAERAREEAERAREEAELARKEAESANAAKSEFLSRMSHELRTPMNSILGFAQILEMDSTDDKHAKRVGHIIKAGRHLLQLINEVLDMARLEASQMRLSPEPIAINNTVHVAIDLVRHLGVQDKLSIVLNLHDCSDLYVMADQQRLSQVLLNLLSNAIKYNRPGGEVRVSCQRRDDEWLRVSVADTGNGIAPEYLDQLFQPFERLGADPTIEGTGLGLSLSKRLIEAMNGRMGMETTVGVGSTFWIELPLTAGPMQRINEQPKLAPAFETPENCKILYIEDNLVNMQVIRHVLWNYPKIELLSAMQGQLGLDLARQQQPSLILLDLHLPDINGDEVLRRLRQDPLTNAIPVVMLSADASARQIVRLLDMGAAEYLTKPFDVRHLLEVMRRLLQL